MSQSLYKRYFELVPVNNITTFSVNAGVNQITFLIPPIGGATLNTKDLMFTGEISIDKDDGSAYTKADFGTTDVSMDSVNGLHNLINRVDITSQGSGNSLIEQRRQYPLINKFRRATLSKNDLVNGKYNNQQLCSLNSNGAMNFLSREANKTGSEFAIQLNTGFLMDNVQDINLGAANGIMIKIYLSEVANALFNVGTTPGSKANNNWNISMNNVRLFGRYNYVTQPLLQQMSRVNFRKINDLMSVVQSSGDTLANQPQVMSCHKIVHIFQPNATTSNNIDANNSQTNQLVGLKQYTVSNNGTRFPYEYPIVNTPSISELPVSSGDQTRVAGNAEQCRLLISAFNSQFPPVHSLVNAENQARAFQNDKEGKIVDTLNVDAVAVDYSYGFLGYTLPMPNNLLQLNLESSVKTNDPIVVPTVSAQTATNNSFVEYDSTLQYAGMQLNA